MDVIDFKSPSTKLHTERELVNMSREPFTHTLKEHKKQLLLFDMFKRFW